MISSFHCIHNFSSGLLFPIARHILCEKQGKINEAYKKLEDGWLSNGDKVPPAEFAKVFFFWRSYNDFYSCFSFKSLFWFSVHKGALVKYHNCFLPPTICC